MSIKTRHESDREGRSLSWGVLRLPSFSFNKVPRRPRIRKHPKTISLARQRFLNSCKRELIISLPSTFATVLTYWFSPMNFPSYSSRRQRNLYHPSLLHFSSVRNILYRLDQSTILTFHFFAVRNILCCHDQPSYGRSTNFRNLMPSLSALVTRNPLNPLMVFIAESLIFSRFSGLDSELDFWTSLRG